MPQKDTLTYRFPAGRLFLITVLAASLDCTAYFNTYYNAKMAFKEGQASHLKLLRDNPDSIVVTPPTDAAAKYDRTIEKTIKVIETFPKTKKWHDDALLLMGKAHFYKKEMLKAIRCFRQLEQEFPASTLLPEAFLYMGKAYIEEGNLDKAEEVLSLAEKRYPLLNKDHEITLLLIMIAIRREGKSQAIQLLEQMAKSIKSEDLRIDLQMRTAELYIDLKQYDKAIMLLKKTPRRKEFPLQSYRMDRALLTCYRAIDSLPAAYDLMNAMIAKKNYDAFMDEMLFLKGGILFEMGKTDEAIKVYRKLTAGIDSASVSGDTSNFKARALLELALIYQKDKEDYKKAQSYLKLASAARDTGTNRFAKNRLTAMERLNKLRSEGGAGDSSSGQQLFSIGELFRFELDEPDSAYEQFLTISRDTTLDTGLIPKALCQAALIARDQLHDTLQGDSIFRLIIKRYPATEYAKTGQHELALPLTIKTRKDSAMEAYRHAEKLFYQENDVKGAIRAFFELSKNFPELPVSAKSLFAAAWFSDNVLLKKQTAKTLYEKICDKYPETVYCTDQAKPRIKIVVDTLEKLDRLRKENERKRPARKEARRKPDEKAGKRPDGISISPRSVTDDASDPLTTEEINNETLPASAQDAVQPFPAGSATAPVSADSARQKLPVSSSVGDSTGR
ncbi:MAG: tetratricopeptide repeat protein [Chitinispirillaceae bacterium]|nr:tetratricopeptide repeat protein [Chitinispirillaceae bacterium]